MSVTRRPPVRPGPRVGAQFETALGSSPGFFMHQVRDPGGTPLVVADHHRRWLDLLASERRLVLLAPRDHGKTTTAVVHVLHQCWLHGRDRSTGQQIPGPPGTLSVLIVTATIAQAEVIFAVVRDLVAASPHLFGELEATSRDGRGRTIASKNHLRFTNGAEIQTRPYGGSVRGIHPDVLLLDDVLTDANTGSQDQRDRAWRYFQGTLLPMHPRQLIVLGTTLHDDDLMHRLKPRAVGGVGGTGVDGTHLRLHVAPLPRHQPGDRADALARPTPVRGAHRTRGGRTYRLRPRVHERSTRRCEFALPARSHGTRPRRRSRLRVRVRILARTLGVGRHRSRPGGIRVRGRGLQRGDRRRLRPPDRHTARPRGRAPPGPRLSRTGRPHHRTVRALPRCSRHRREQRLPGGGSSRNSTDGPRRA